MKFKKLDNNFAHETYLMTYNSKWSKKYIFLERDCCNDCTSHLMELHLCFFSSTSGAKLMKHPTLSIMTGMFSMTDYTLLRLWGKKVKGETRYDAGPGLGRDLRGDGLTTFVSSSIIKSYFPSEDLKLSQVIIIHQ